MKPRGRNALIFVIDDILVFLRRKLGIFGPFSFKLLLGLTLGLISLAAFAKLSEDLLFNELLAFDRVGTDLIRFFMSDLTTVVMVNISRLGSPMLLIVVGIFMMVYTGAVRKHFWDTVLIPTVLTGGIILNTALKHLFQRQRPGLPWLDEASGFSFPSGHAMLSFIFYGLMLYLIWVNVSARIVKLIVAVILTVVILGIGISRVYLGVHYPSDVLAGYAAGSLWLVACILCLRGIRYYKAGA